MKFVKRTLAVGLGAVLSLAIAPFAQADTAPMMKASDPTPTVGQAFTVSGEGCLADGDKAATLLIDYQGKISTAKPAADGTWSASLTAVEGAGTIKATCDGYGAEFAYPSLTVTGEPDLADVAVTGEFLKAVRDGCKVTISTKTTGLSDFTLQVWDDGDVINSFTWKEGGTRDSVWTITRPAGTQAAGVDFVLTTSDGMLDHIENFEYPASAANECSAAVKVSIAIPDYNGSTVAGAKHTVTGKGYLPGEKVTLTFALYGSEDPGKVVATAIVGEDGTFSTTFVVPAWAPGGYALYATGDDSGRSDFVRVKVVKPGSGIGLPHTGN